MELFGNENFSGEKDSGKVLIIIIILFLIIVVIIIGLALGIVPFDINDAENVKI